jgi:hypothetical protein
MKKLFLIVGLMTMSGAAFAQGSVNWAGISPAAMTAETNESMLSPLFGGGATGVGVNGPVAPAGAYYFELLYAPYTGVQATIPSLAVLLSWSDAGLGATNGNTAGRLAPINGNAGAVVPWSPGTTDSIVLVGWSSNLGTTWGAVSNVLAYWGDLLISSAYLGVSTTGYITPLASSVSPGAQVFGSAPTPQGLPIFSLNTPLYFVPVPEPGTLALAGLGGLAFWLFRRIQR